jgi:methylase of polypeptide subunit release factors
MCATPPDYEIVNLSGYDIKIKTSPETFSPTLTTKLLAKNAVVPVNGTVLDLGCGVGAIAIVAALQGASAVTAADIMPEACRLAGINAELNGVADRVTVICSNLFASVEDRQFDAIVNDVSGVADEIARISPWYPPSIPTGGQDGADMIVPMLRDAPSHLSPHGVLYFATGSISNVARTLSAANDAFSGNVELLEEVDVPFPKEFVQNMDTMFRLQREGILDFKTRRSRHLWTLQVYRCWK